MRSRAARAIIGAVALAAVGAAGFRIFQIEKQIAQRRAALRAFEVRAREASDAVSDLRIAQAAYVAAGQGVAFWMPKVSSLTDTITSAIGELRSSATSDEARAALDGAAAAMTEFTTIDTRARDYLKSMQQLMAADVVFTEGGNSAATVARQAQNARSAEQQAGDAIETADRKEEAATAGAAAAALVAVVLLLAPRPRTMTATELAGAEPVAPPVGNDLSLREALVAPAAYTTARSSRIALKSAAALCTDLGRVKDVEELKALLARASEVLDASGVIVWLSAPGGGDLRPALAHGYGPQGLARIPTVPRSADNAAAAAVRTGQLQIVLARPGSSNGAVVAPLLSPEGCIGALSAEIRGGAETSDDVQGLAAIFAAQLAGILHAAGEAADERSEPRVSSA